MIDWLVGWLIDWMIDWSIDWLIDWLIEWMDDDDDDDDDDSGTIHTLIYTFLLIDIQSYSLPMIDELWCGGSPRSLNSTKWAIAKMFLIIKKNGTFVSWRLLPPSQQWPQQGFHV